jgi:ABC-2 type transport system permease protein
MVLRRAAAQFRKEVAQFRRDRFSVLLTFVLPVVMLLIFGYAIRLEAHDVPLAVVDGDRSPASRAIAERLVATNVFRFVPTDPAHPEAVLERGEASGVLIVPPGTERALRAARPAPLQLVVDGADVVNATIVKNDAIAAVAGGPPPVAAAVRIWFNPGRRESLYIVPGVYAIVLGIFPAMLAAMAIVRDREEGTILQTYVSAMSAGEYLSGKIAAYAAIALGEAGVVMGAGVLLWGLVPVADPTPLLVCTPLYLATVVALGTLVGTQSLTQSAALQMVATVSNLPAILFSGFLYPLQNVPPPLAWLANAVPAYYFIGVTRDAFVRGTGWSAVWPAVPGLAGLCALFAAVAWLKLRRMRLPG